MRDRVRQFVEEELNPISLQVETSGEIPQEIVDKMRELGLFGLSILEEYGGLVLTTLEEIMVYEELTQTNACFRSRIGTSNSIGSMGILFDGTEDQKQNYLPKIASGKWTAAFALTEPDAGSDASSIQASAVLDGDQWILNGTKLFITNGDSANVFTTIAVTDEDKRARGGFTAFIIENDFSGFSVSPPDKKMDIFEDEGYLKESQIEMFLRDVRLYRIFEGTSEIQRMVISRNLLRH
jgi:acyl-CoA dehydrogenase